MILRETGVLTGVVAILVIAICFVLGPGPRRISDRFLLVAALVVGWLPLFGWIPGIEVHVDLPGVLLSLAVGVVCGYQFLRNKSTSRTVARPTLAEGIALALGVLTTLWWARPALRFSSSGIIGALQRTGYDNVSHFNMFRQNLQLGSFIQVRSRLPGGSTRLDNNYPQGLHQSWALFIRLLHPHPSTATTWLLHSYLDLLLLTAGFTVALGCVAVSRLCRRDALVAVPAMAVVVALFAVGRFGPFSGFANFELATASVAVAVLLMVRPTLPPGWNFFAVAGLGLVAAYNWYPLLILMAPALIVASLRAVFGAHGRTRVVIASVVVLTAIAYLLPVTVFSGRGVGSLTWSGADLAPPWGLLIVSLVSLGVLVAVRQASHPDLVTSVIAGGPAVLGAGMVVLIAAYEAHSLGNVNYYGQKVAVGVLGVCIIVLAGLAALQLTNSGARRRLSTPVAAVLAALLAVAALQVEGYFGPESATLQSRYNATGIALRSLLYQQPSSSSDGQHLLTAAQVASNQSGHWWYLEPDPPSGVNFVLLSQWFWVLRGNATNQEGAHVRSVVPLLIDGALTPNQIAHVVIEDFPNPGRNGFHLFVPLAVKRAIVEMDPSWASPGQLLVIPMGDSGSGH